MKNKFAFHHQGVTLLEVIISMVVISLSLIAFFTLLLSIMQWRENTTVQWQKLHNTNANVERSGNSNEKSKRVYTF